MNSQKDFCFCTLSLGTKYRIMSKQLANDLAQYAPGIFLVIGTDRPKDFAENKNILAFKHYQKGILHCYNDKRFVIREALSKFKTAIFIDTDTRITSDLPNNLEFPPGIIARQKNMLEHINKYRIQNVPIIEKLAQKLNIPINKVKWIGESLFIVTKNQGKENEFLNFWALMSTYLELKGMHSGEGSIMGLAAAKVGWDVETNETWDNLNKITQHLDASHDQQKLTSSDQLKRKLAYHYRLNKTRLLALKNYNFYYR